MSVADRAQAEKWVGRAMKRKEDPKLITGRGNYVEDISLPGTLWAAFVRSPEAHARIVSIDASAAEMAGAEARPEVREEEPAWAHQA